MDPGDRFDGVDIRCFRWAEFLKIADVMPAAKIFYIPNRRRTIRRAERLGLLGVATQPYSPTRRS